MLALLSATAQGTTSRQYAASDVMIYAGVLLALLIVLATVASLLRRRYMNQSNDDAPPLGFTLKDLREMHAAGQLSDEELAKAEAKSLAASRALYLGPDQTDEPVESDLDDPAGDAVESDAEEIEQPDDLPPDDAPDANRLPRPDDDPAGPDKTG